MFEIPYKTAEENLETAIKTLTKAINHAANDKAKTINIGKQKMQALECLAKIFKAKIPQHERNKPHKIPALKVEK